MKNGAFFKYKIITIEYIYIFQSNEMEINSIL